MPAWPAMTVAPVSRSGSRARGVVPFRVAVPQRFRAGVDEQGQIEPRAFAGEFDRAGIGGIDVLGGREPFHQGRPLGEKSVQHGQRVVTEWVDRRAEEEMAYAVRADAFRSEAADV